MEGRAIETFDVRIERGAGDYAVVADSSYGGTYRARFRDSIDRDEIAVLRRSLTRHVGRDVGGTGIDEPGVDPSELARRIGGVLFETLFAGELRDGLRDTMTLARRDGHPLRIRLRMEATPELGPLPWELLRDEDRGRFIAASSQVQVVRHLGRPEPVRDVVLQGPLRVLVVVASPTDLPPLGVEHEWQLLVDELAPLVTAGRVELRRVDPPTFDRLGRVLLDGPWHVFHFIGHGAEASSALMFCDAAGRGEPVPADALAVALADTVDLRLAVLNACHTARASERDAFLGVAQVLLEHSVPAVVAMQFAISDEAAIAFAGRFYAAMSHGWAVDRAVGDARKSLYQHGVEWATPVVHLRGDGVVFDVPDRPRSSGEPRRVRRRRRSVVAAVLLALAFVTAGIYALLVRGGDGDEAGELGDEATAEGLTGCPGEHDGWTRHELADDPSGTVVVTGGSLSISGRFLVSRRQEDGWDVVVGVALRNHTAEEISLGEHYVQRLVVATRPYAPWCFDPYTTLDPGLTADLLVGFEVSCEPVGRIELVAGERIDVPIALTPADAEPGPC